MPQEIQILQCFKCNFFQGQLVKRKPQWECKMCFEKQSVKKVFMRSENGRECREYVQQLNLMHQETHMCKDDKDDGTNICISDNKGNEISSWKEDPLNVVPQMCGERNKSKSKDKPGQWHAFLTVKEVKPKSYCDKSKEGAFKHSKPLVNGHQVVYGEKDESQSTVNQSQWNEFLDIKDSSCVNSTDSHKRTLDCDETEGSIKYLRYVKPFKSASQIVISKDQSFCKVKNIFENEDTDLDLDI